MGGGKSKTYNCNQYNCSTDYYNKNTGTYRAKSSQNSAGAACCVRTQKCSAYTCPATKHKKPITATNMYCTLKNCNVNECCATNATCKAPGAFSCSATYSPKTAPVAICPAKVCTTAVCCDRNGTCAGYPCPGSYSTKLNAPTYCPSKTCTTTVCCDRHEMCSAYPCGADKTETGRVAPCAQRNCEDSECCTQNQACSAFECAAGFTKMVSPPTYCLTPLCDSSACCDRNEQCSELSCPQNYANTGRVAPCAARKCLVDECCSQETSGATCVTLTTPCKEGHTLQSGSPCPAAGCTETACCLAPPGSGSLIGIGDGNGNPGASAPPAVANVCANFRCEDVAADGFDFTNDTTKWSFECGAACTSVKCCIAEANGTLKATGGGGGGGGGSSGEGAVDGVDGHFSTQNNTMITIIIGTACVLLFAGVGMFLYRNKQKSTLRSEITDSIAHPIMI